MEQVAFDPRLQGPFTMMVAGPTSCGKSQLVLNLIKNTDTLVYPPVKDITYCYTQWQPAFEELQGRVTFREGMISREEVMSPGKAGRAHSLLVIDDLTDEENGPLVKDLFIRGSHHRRISVIFITQNLFLQGKDFRTISINSHYVILFKNPRDRSQIQSLARQCFPGNSRFLTDVYTSETSDPHSYIVLDFKQDTPDRLRVRNSITSPKKTGVFIPTKKK